MDKRKLSKEELQHINAFIISRSARFAEPGILIEITDHFACKTEEILNNEPGLSFSDAMHKAHQSFGVKGFAPIAAAWEERTYKRYKRWKWVETKHLLFSVHGLGLVLTACLVARIYLFLKAEELLWINGLELFLPFAIAYLLSAYKVVILPYSGRKRHPLLYEMALRSNFHIFIEPIIFIPLLNEWDNVQPVLAGSFLGFLAAAALFYMLFNNRLHNKVREEAGMLDTQLDLIQ